LRPKSIQNGAVCDYHLFGFGHFYLNFREKSGLGLFRSAEQADSEQNCLTSEPRFIGEVTKRAHDAQSVPL
jgi:hypothetical protein